MNLIINIITNPRPYFYMAGVVASVVTVAAYLITEHKTVKG